MQTAGIVLFLLWCGFVTAPIVTRWHDLFERFVLSSGTPVVQVNLGNDAVALDSHPAATHSDFTSQRTRTVLIAAKWYYRVMLKFRGPIFEVTERPISKEDWQAGDMNCNNSRAYLEIYDGPSVTFPLMHRFCGADWPKPDLFFSTGEFLTLKVVTPGPQTGFSSVADFRFHVNNWRAPENCSEDDMRCDDLSCIPKRLLCDRYNFPHCPDSTDRKLSLRQWCFTDPPIDLFGYWWLFRLLLIYLAVLSVIPLWFCCVRPGHFWYLIGCFRRWDCWPAICSVGCPFHFISCTDPSREPTDPTSVFSYVEYEEIEYLEEDDTDGYTGGMTSHRTGRRTKKRSRGDSGLDTMSHGSTAPDPPPPYSRRTRGGPIGGECSSAASQGRVQVDLEGDTRATATDTANTSNVIQTQPPNVCLFEEWDMHVRENR